MNSWINTRAGNTNWLMYSGDTKWIWEASALKWKISRKGVNELMYQYRGREDELISNLKRLQQDQEHSTINPSSSLLEIRAEVESFVERTNPGKSVDDLMYEYRGR